MGYIKEYRREKMNFFIAFTFLLLALFLNISCDKKAESKSESAPNTQFKFQRKPLVRVMPVRLKDVVYRIETTGSLIADRINVYSNISGIVKKVNFKEGDVVKAGKTILAEIDPEYYEIELLRTKAQLEGSYASLKRAKLEYRNRLALYKKGYAPFEELLLYKTKVYELHSLVRQHYAIYKLAKKNYRESKITPPVDGIIQKKEIYLGNYVRPDTLIATMVDISSLRVKFLVEQSKIRALNIGQNISFSISTFPDKKFSATVFYISQYAEPQTRMVECQANNIMVEETQEGMDGKVVLQNVLNSQVMNLLKPGFFVEISIDSAVHKNALVIPLQAVVPSEKGFTVYILKDKVAYEKEVQVGLYTKDSQVEIISGLNPNDLIVVEGANVLKDGMEVEIIE
jgi:RND family efflux transporter MFP subunit